jgi:hypothetical protein
MASRYRVYLLMGVAALLVWFGARSPDESEVAKMAMPMMSETPLLQQQSTFAEQNKVPPPLPTKLNRVALEHAGRNPFVLSAPTPVLVAKPVTASPPPPAPPQAPSPPAVNLSFAGRMTAPDGSQVIYVNYANEPLAIGVGQTLPNGYRVDAITARAVELSYPPLNTTARLDLPASPKYEIR